LHADDVADLPGPKRSGILAAAFEPPRVRNLLLVLRSIGSTDILARQAPGIVVLERKIREVLVTAYIGDKIIHAGSGKYPAQRLTGLDRRLALTDEVRDVILQRLPK